MPFSDSDQRSCSGGELAIAVLAGYGLAIVADAALGFTEGAPPPRATTTSLAGTLVPQVSIGREGDLAFGLRGVF